MKVSGQKLVMQVTNLSKWESNKRKPLGVHIDRTLSFDEHV